MALITLQNITKSYGSGDLFKNVTLELNPGEKAGLIGANGTGKTTLLKIAAGIDEPDKGSVIQTGNIRTAYVPQYHQYEETATAEDILISDFLPIEKELRRSEERLAEADDTAMEQALQDYQRIRDVYDSWDGDSVRSRTSRILGQLGLEIEIDQKVGSLSGGEKNTLAIGRALMSKPELLLLDEPGNHLDFTGLAWLEAFLNAFKGAVLIVSHNRYLLDKTVKTVFELEAGKITRYTGNYSGYRVAKLTNALAQAQQYSAEQKKLERLENLVKKFEEIASRIADPSWGKRLRARRSQLSKARENAVEAPARPAEKMRISFAGNDSGADIALRIKKYSKSFPGKELFRETGLQLNVGERAALIGENGSGKTTLLKDIVNLGHWDHPVIQVGPSMRIGYCAQNQEVFSGEDTVLDAFLKLETSTKSRINYLLSKFLFTWDDLDKPVAVLSGGELNRLQLARTLFLGANFLILDEPTNHLDIQAKEAVEEGLDDFDGTVLTVSHDRYFLERIADTVFYIEDRCVKKHSGDFSSVI
ncbi:MAG: ribosomal protection-like ABC-F family protein, partial [Spirochaetia bacterium]